MKTVNKEDPKTRDVRLQHYNVRLNELAAAAKQKKDQQEQVRK